MNLEQIDTNLEELQAGSGELLWVGSSGQAGCRVTCWGRLAGPAARGRGGRRGRAAAGSMEVVRRAGVVGQGRRWGERKIHIKS
jgi:hypothetical protein